MAKRGHRHEADSVDPDLFQHLSGYTIYNQPNKINFQVKNENFQVTFGGQAPSKRPVHAFSTTLLIKMAWELERGVQSTDLATIYEELWRTRGS